MRASAEPIRSRQRRRNAGQKASSVDHASGAHRRHFPPSLGTRPGYRGRSRTVEIHHGYALELDPRNELGWPLKFCRRCDRSSGCTTPTSGLFPSFNYWIEPRGSASLKFAPAQIRVMTEPDVPPVRQRPILTMPTGDPAADSKLSWHIPKPTSRKLLFENSLRADTRWHAVASRSSTRPA